MNTAIKRTRHARWWPLLLLLVLAAIATAVFLLRRPATTSTTTAETVETATASNGAFRVSVTGPGTLVAHQSVDLKPQVQGTILYLPKVGDRVTKGQLVARIDPSNYQRSVDSAQLALSKAQAQLESARSSQTSSIASQQQSIANAQAAFDNAQNQLEASKTSLESTKRVFAAGGATQQALNDAQRNFEQAQNNLESTRVALRTAQQALPLRQSSNTQDLRNLQLAIDQANLTLKNARQDLGNTKLYAPFNGTVSAVNAQVGAVGVNASVSGSSALLSIIDDSSVDLPVQVDETEITKVRVKQTVDVTLDAFNNEHFNGTVTAISPSATVVQNIAVFYVTVNVPNPDRKLRPGMTAEGEIISQEIPDAVLIPVKAVEKVRTRAYVQVQGETDRRRVKTGPDDGVNIVITDGLKSGEVVILPTRTQTTTTTQRQGGGLGIPLGR